MDTQQTIPIDHIQESSTQPRRRYRDLDELEASIRASGIYQPILVRPAPNGGGRPYECVFGHRRLRAAAAAGLDKIPANVRDLDDAGVLEAQLVENCQRDDVDPLDEADTYRAIIAGGVMDVEDIAAKVGKSKSHVSKRLQLANDLGSKAREALEGELIGAGVALLLTRLEGKLQDKALKVVASPSGEAPMRYREAARRLRPFTEDLRRAPFPTKDAGLLVDVGACTTCPNRSGNQTDLFGSLAGDEPEVCTNPECHAAKVKAHWERAKAKAEAQGQPVLKTKEVFGHDKYYAGLQRGLVLAKDSPSQAVPRKGRAKSWKGFVGKALKPSVTQHPTTGEVVEVYELKEAKKALAPEDKARLYPPRPKAAASGASTSSGKGEVNAPEPSWDDIDEETNRRWMARMVARLPGDDSAFVRNLAEGLFGGRHSGRQLAEALGWVEIAKSSWLPLSSKEQETVTKHLLRMTPAEARAVVLFELDRETDLSATPVFAGLGLGIDRHKVEKEVTEELRAKLKAEAKTKAAEEKAKAKPAKKKAAKKAPRRKKKAS